MGHRPHTFVLALLGSLAIGACGGPAAPDARAPQSIQFGPLPDRLAGEPPFQIAATASSGMTVSFSAAGECAVSGDVVTLSGVPGACVVTASQGGDAAFRPAADVVRAFAVTIGFRRIGLVLLSETGVRGREVIDAHGTFVERGEPLGDVFDGVAFGSGGASCAVSPVIEPGPDDAPDPTPGGDVTPVDAGAVLTVRASGTAYAELTTSDVGVYGLAPDGAVSPLPSGGLTLEVPGADFPGFSAAEFSNAAPLVLAPGFGIDDVTVDTTFSWAAGDGSAVVLFVGAGGGVTFSCLVPDEGTFAFDEVTRAQLVAAGFAAGRLEAVGRLSAAAHTRADAALVLGVVRLETLVGASGGHGGDAWVHAVRRLWSPLMPTADR